MSTSIIDVVKELDSGVYDEVLDDLIDMLVVRRRYVRDQKASENRAAFGPGTRVRVTEGISPKYMEGMTGTVSSRYAAKAGYVKVIFDYSRGRFLRGVEVSMPANCLEEI